MTIFFWMLLAADPAVSDNWKVVPIESADASDLAYGCFSNDNTKSFILTFNNKKNFQNLTLEFVRGSFDGTQKTVSINNAITGAKFNSSPENISFLVEHTYLVNNFPVQLNLIVHKTTRAEFDVDNGVNSFDARCIKLPPKPKPVVEDNEAKQ